MKKPINILLGVWFFIVVFVIACGMLGLSGCRTVDLFKTSSQVDSTGTQTTKYDSTGYRLYFDLLKHYKEITKEYKPGRDSIIYVNGEPKIITMPPQIIRERTIEHGEQTTHKEEKATVSKTDSLLYELLRTNATKDKDTSSIPVWGWIVFGALAYFLLKDLISPRINIRKPNL